MSVKRSTETGIPERVGGVHDELVALCGDKRRGTDCQQEASPKNQRDGQGNLRPCSVHPDHSSGVELIRSARLGEHSQSFSTLRAQQSLALVWKPGTNGPA
jgi:hypothetical protein